MGTGPAAEPFDVPGASEPSEPGDESPRIVFAAKSLDDRPAVRRAIPLPAVG